MFREAYRRHEVEVVCVDLLKRYQHTVNIYPPINPAACLAGKLSHSLKSTKYLQIYQLL